MEVTHFDLNEFTASDLALRRRIANHLPEELEPNAWATLSMLEGIRAHLSSVAGKDVPVFISSGYRCPQLNDAVGGVPSSDHVKAMAADIRAPAFGNPLQVAQELSKHVDELGIGQLINEFPGPGGIGGWVHVSTRKPEKSINRIITISTSGTSVGIIST